MDSKILLVLNFFDLFPLRYVLYVQKYFLLTPLYIVRVTNVHPVHQRLSFVRVRFFVSHWLQTASILKDVKKKLKQQDEITWILNTVNPNS